MTAFPAFLIYSLTALVISGFEVQSVLLSRLSLWETVLYCTAKVLITVGVLFASIQYRIFRDKRMWGYVVVAAMFLSLGSLYSMFNTFSGRFAVSLNSGQTQDADLSEATAMSRAADQKGKAADANTAASERYAASTRRGSLRGQLDSASKAATQADQSAHYASRAAQLQREAGVTEKQVLALVSPWQLLPTMMVTAAWFAIVLELLNLLSAAGAADYIVSRWRGVTGQATGQRGNVVPLPSSSPKRGGKQLGRMAVDDAVPNVPGHIPANVPVNVPINVPRNVPPNVPVSPMETGTLMGTSECTSDGTLGGTSTGTKKRSRTKRDIVRLVESRQLLPTFANLKGVMRQIEADVLRRQWATSGLIVISPSGRVNWTQAVGQGAA